MTSELESKINVTVEVHYLKQESNSMANSYAYAYTVTISNNSDRWCQLLNRHWIITDAEGRTEEVQGEGVVGEFPTIKPGETFEYTSGTPLKTNNGIMQGFYLVSQDNGENLKIDIPTFSLDSPYNKKNVH